MNFLLSLPFIFHSVLFLFPVFIYATLRVMPLLIYLIHSSLLSSTVFFFLSHISCRNSTADALWFSLMHSTEPLIFLFLCLFFTITIIIYAVHVLIDLTDSPFFYPLILINLYRIISFTLIHLIHSYFIFVCACDPLLFIRCTLLFILLLLFHPRQPLCIM